MNGWATRTAKGKNDLGRMLRKLQPAETKLREDPVNAGSSSEFKGYKFLGHPRTTPVHKDKEVRGGGLATLVRVDIGAKELPVVHGPTDYPDDVTELQLVEVHVAGKTIRCLNVYRPPCEQSRGVSGDDRVPAMDPRTWPPDVDVVAGDVNLRHPVWDAKATAGSRIRMSAPSKETDGKHPLAQMLLDDALDKGLSLLTDRGTPTHTSGHVLDVMFVSGDYDCRRGFTEADRFGSDHYPVVAEFLDLAPTSYRGASCRRAWDQANWRKFGAVVEACSAASLRQITTETSVEAMLFLFNAGLRQATKVSVPQLRRLTRHGRRRKSAKKKALARRLRKELTGEEVEHGEDDADAAKAAALAAFCGELPECENQAAQLVFSKIRELEGEEKKNVPTAAVQKPGGAGTFADSPGEKAEVFADVFADVCKGPDTGLDMKIAMVEAEVECAPGPVEGLKEKLRQLRRLRKRARHLLDVQCEAADSPAEVDEDISLLEVQDALRRLPKKKAAGMDGIACEPLQHLGPAATQLLLRIFRKVYRDGVWPGDWAVACIVPVLKRGKDPSLPGSYRPVSLTSVLAKLCERVIEARLRTATHGQLSAVQAGFRRGRSTMEHLAACHLRLLQHTSDGKYSAMLCADLSRAFDRVNHRKLLQRLGRDFGVRGRLWNVIRAFLGNRSAVVKVDGVASRPREMEMGVPQGTILAPQLFTLFVDDLARRLQAAGLDCLLYADDVAFLVSATDVRDLRRRVARGLAIIEEWAEGLQLQLSREKTEVLVRDPDGNPFEITVEYAEPDTQGAATPLRCVSRLRYLGMHFAATADPPDSAAKTLARLSTLRILAASPWASTQLLRTVYLSYVLGASRYGLALAAEGSLKELEHVHRRALLLITGCHPATTLAMLGAEAGIPSLRDLARQEATVLRELLLRLPPEAPGYRACVKCDKLPGTWLAGAATVCTTLGLDELKREKLWSQKPFKPWACPVPTIIPVVPGCERRGEEELEAVAKCRRLDAFYRAYDALPKAATTVCTDGSAAKGRCPPTTVNGRAGVVASGGARRHDGALCGRHVRL